MPEPDEFLPLPIPVPYAGRAIKPKNRPGKRPTSLPDVGRSTHRGSNVLHSALLAALYGQTGRKISSGEGGTTAPRNFRMMTNSYQPNLKKALTESLRKNLTTRIKRILSTEPHISELKKMRSEFSGISEANQPTNERSRFSSYLSAFLRGIVSGAGSELRRPTPTRQKRNKGTKLMQAGAASPDSLSGRPSGTLGKD